jgi:hypothetical protein
MKPAVHIEDEAVTVDVDAFQKHGVDFMSMRLSDGRTLAIKRSDKWVRRRDRRVRRGVAR